MGSHSKIGTKNWTAFLTRPAGFSFLNCWNGSSGKKVSLRSDFNVVAKPLGGAKLTRCSDSITVPMEKLEREREKQRIENLGG